MQFIDPLTQPAKEDALINDVSNKYGGEVKAYKGFLDDYARQYKTIKDETSAESKGVGDLPFDKVQDQDLARAMLLIIDTVQGFPQFLDNKQDSIDRRLKQKPPDYKGAVDSVQSAMEELSQRLGAIDDEITKDKDNAATPDAVKGYLTSALPRFIAIKKQADDIDASAKKLGDLKLDTLRTSLKEKDSILVMGDNDLRVLPFDQVWRTEDTMRQYAHGGKVKPTFAGEQLITTAIHGLTQPTRTKIVFVRPGGAPLCDPGIPGFQAGGPLSEAADRLRQYNFEVTEKDLSGQYAMQAQMQGQQAGPEPTDAEMKDAIWVVIAAPFNNRSQTGEPPPPPALAPRLTQHLAEGGSAFVLPFPQDDSATSALAAVGIDLRTDAVAVHDTPPPSGSASDDPADNLQRYPFVFDIRKYGDSPITAPLRSLDSLLVPLLPVKTHAVKGYAVNTLLPIPDAPSSPRSWGETDLASLQKNDPPTFDAKTDIAGPLFAGATSERLDDKGGGDKGGGRVVAIASPYFIFNTTLNEPDPDLARKGMFVSRFPGNTELFCNSIFWLSHQESMISISPSAMQVSRIADMSDATLNLWRVGVLLIGLPGAVIVAGCLVFFARRD